MVKVEEQLRELKYSEKLITLSNFLQATWEGKLRRSIQIPELNSDYIELPESLEMFLQILLHGEPKQGTKKMERVVQSIGQDCIYAVSRGNVNHPGHGISYSKLEETDTALCLQKQRQEADQGIVLPSSCYPHIPTSLVFDNIDRLEETLSGGGTSHRVNGSSYSHRFTQ